MPICIPNDLPAADVLQRENIFVMRSTRAETQNIRPLEIVLLNLMPTKIATETQLARLLGNTPIQVELELLAQAQLRCRRTVTLLQDLYSTAWQTQLDHRPLALQRFGPGSIRPQAVRELLETGESVRSVADSRLAIGQVSQNREGEQLVLTAEAWLTVLYQDGEDRLQCIHRTVPVSCRLDCPEDCRCLCTVRRQGEVYAAPAAGGVEVRFTLEFGCLPVQTLSVPAVCGGSLGEARDADGEKRPSVVLRFAVRGEEIWDIAKAYGDEARFIFYYAGHGVPDESNGTAYLLPVDGKSSILATGYSISKLYDQLHALGSQNVTVVMDACFSGSKRGEGMLASARGVAIKSKAEAPKGNMLVISAAQGNETAYPYREKRHGLFTYFLLKKLQETKGNTTFGELFDYVRTQVAQKSIVVNEKSQTPSVNASSELTSTWKQSKLF